jgi:hypothetical protein
MMEEREINQVVEEWRDVWVMPVEVELPSLLVGS